MGRAPIDLKRHPPVRESKRLVLIVYSSEIEEGYFRSVVDNLGGYPATLRASGDRRANLPALVRLAAEISRSERRKGSAYDEVWCVVSGPADTSDGPALDQARRAGIRIARSDPSFDLWLLLHILEISDPTSASELEALRVRHISEDLAFVDHHERAASRAARLREQHADSGGMGNPGTDVDRLVGSLFESMRKFLQDGEL